MSQPVYEFGPSQKIGESAERLVRHYLQRAGYVCKQVGQKNGTWEDSEFSGVYSAPDLLIESHSSGQPKALTGKTIEVKACTRAHETGNVALEVMSNAASGRLGWLHTCSADYLAHLSLGDGKLIVVPMGAVRQRFQEVWHRSKFHGIHNPLFTSIMVAVPRADVEKLALHVTTIQ